MFEAVAKLRTRPFHHSLKVFDSNDRGVIVEAQPWLRQVGSIDVSVFDATSWAHGPEQPCDARIASTSVRGKDEIEV